MQIVVKNVPVKERIPPEIDFSDKQDIFLLWGMVWRGLHLGKEVPDPYQMFLLDEENIPLDVKKLVEASKKKDDLSYLSI